MLAIFSFSERKQTGYHFVRSPPNRKDQVLAFHLDRFEIKVRQDLVWN